VRVDGTSVHDGSINEPDQNDTFTMQYVRLGNSIKLFGGFNFVPIFGSSTYFLANITCSFVNPPSWLQFANEPTSYTTSNTANDDHGEVKTIGSAQTGRLNTNYHYNFTGDIHKVTSTSFLIALFSDHLWTGSTNVRMSISIDTMLDSSSSGSPYYRIPSLRANHAYQQRDEIHTITVPARGSGGAVQWTDVTDGSSTFSVTITPSSINAKIELFCLISYSESQQRTSFAFTRGGTTVLLPASSGNRTSTISGGDGPNNETSDYKEISTTELRYFDEPATTSPVTYTVVVGTENASSDVTFVWNRSYESTDGQYHNNGLSTFSAQEIDAAPQLSNVSTTGAQAGQALVYNSSNQWVPATAGGFSCQIFRVTTNQTAIGSDTLIDDWAVPNNALHANFGSYVSVSSGIFSFSKTGFYRVDLTILGSQGTATSDANHHNGYIYTSDDGGSTYEASARAITQEGSGGDSASTSAVLSITNLANSKVKVEYFNTDGRIDGSSSQTKSFIMFSRIGDA
jgi:hypothetical protein